MATTELDQLAKQSGLTTRKPRSLWADAWRRLRYSITARIGMVISIIIVLTALLAPIVSPYDPKLDSDMKNSRKAPTAEHIMGTDRIGRDIFRRIVHGASLSLSVGFVAVLTAGIAGSVVAFTVLSEYQLSFAFGLWLSYAVTR